MKGLPPMYALEADKRFQELLKVAFGVTKAEDFKTDLQAARRTAAEIISEGDSKDKSLARAEVYLRLFLSTMATKLPSAGSWIDPVPGETIAWYRPSMDKAPLIDAPQSLQTPLIDPQAGHVRLARLPLVLRIKVAVNSSFAKNLDAQTNPEPRVGRELVWNLLASFVPQVEIPKSIGVLQRRLRFMWHGYKWNCPNGKVDWKEGLAAKDWKDECGTGYFAVCWMNGMQGDLSRLHSPAGQLLTAVCADIAPLYALKYSKPLEVPKRWKPVMGEPMIEEMLCDEVEGFPGVPGGIKWVRGDSSWDGDVRRPLFFRIIALLMSLCPDGQKYLADWTKAADELPSKCSLREARAVKLEHLENKLMLLGADKWPKGRIVLDGNLILPLARTSRLLAILSMCSKGLVVDSIAFSGKTPSGDARWWQVEGGMTEGPWSETLDALMKEGEQFSTKGAADWCGGCQTQGRLIALSRAHNLLPGFANNPRLAVRMIADGLNGTMLDEWSTSDQGPVLGSAATSIGSGTTSTDATLNSWQIPQYLERWKNFDQLCELGRMDTPKSLSSGKAMSAAMSSYIGPLKTFYGDVIANPRPDIVKDRAHRALDKAQGHVAKWHSTNGVSFAPVQELFPDVFTSSFKAPGSSATASPAKKASPASSGAASAKGKGAKASTTTTTSTSTSSSTTSSTPNTAKSTTKPNKSTASPATSSTTNATPSNGSGRGGAGERKMRATVDEPSVDTWSHGAIRSVKINKITGNPPSTLQPVPMEMRGFKELHYDASNLVEVNETGLVPLDWRQRYAGALALGKWDEIAAFLTTIGVCKCSPQKPTLTWSRRSVSEVLACNFCPDGHASQVIEWKCSKCSHLIMTDPLDLEWDPGMAAQAHRLAVREKRRKATAGARQENRLSAARQKAQADREARAAREQELLESRRQAELEAARQEEIARKKARDEMLKKQAEAEKKKREKKKAARAALEAEKAEKAARAAAERERQAALRKEREKAERERLKKEKADQEAREREEELARKAAAEEEARLEAEAKARAAEEAREAKRQARLARKEAERLAAVRALEVDAARKAEARYAAQAKAEVAAARKKVAAERRAERQTDAATAAAAASVASVALGDDEFKLSSSLNEIMDDDLALDEEEIFVSPSVGAGSTPVSAPPGLLPTPGPAKAGLLPEPGLMHESGLMASAGSPVASPVDVWGPPAAPRAGGSVPITRNAPKVAVPSGASDVSSVADLLNQFGSPTTSSEKVARKVAVPTGTSDVPSVADLLSNLLDDDEDF